MITLVKQSTDLARQNQRLNPARRGAEANKPVGYLRCEFALRMSGQYQTNGIILYVTGHSNTPDQFLTPAYLLSIDNRFSLGRIPCSCAIEYSAQLLTIAVRNEKLKEKPVQLLPAKGRFLPVRLGSG